MLPTLKMKNVALVGNFSQGLTSALYLYEKGIISRDEVRTPLIEAPGNIYIPTDDYMLVANLQNIVVSSFPNKTDGLKLYDTISKIVTMLMNDESNGSFIAVGLNFQYIVSANEKEMSEYSKKHFRPSNNKVVEQFFSEDNSLYGLYHSVDFNNSRLKFEAKPGELNFACPTESYNEKGIIFSFNYHFDCRDVSGKQKFSEAITRPELFQSRCNEIVSLY